MPRNLIAAGFLALGVAGYAFAQQQQFTPQQAIAASLGQQIGLLSQSIGELQTKIQQLENQITDRDARIKALEDKYEPKEPPK